MTRRWFLVLLLVLALVVAAATAYAAARFAAREERPSGIRGAVFIGCLNTRCATRPLLALQRVYRGSFYGPPPYPTEADIVVTFRSNSDGEFELKLPPGHYTISQTENQRVGGSLNPTDVDVRKSRFTEVRLLYVEPRG